MNIFEQLKSSWSLENELMSAVRSGVFGPYLARARLESKFYLWAESVGWDRETVLTYYTGPDRFFPISVYEQSYDNGSMRSNAESYHRALMAWEEKQKK